MQVQALGGTRRTAWAPRPCTNSSSDPKGQLIAWLYELMLGPNVRKFMPDPGEDGISYSRQDVYWQDDSATFHAEGTLRLKSGVPISFWLDVATNSQGTVPQSLTFRTGNILNPLTLKFDGQLDRGSCRLGKSGRDEWIASLLSGSAWLA